jgi:hypothetical protein
VDFKRRLPEVMAEWHQEFPTLPSFDAFFSKLSSSIQPYRKLIPNDTFAAERTTYERALYWLLEQDLVVQLHTYVRMVASAKVKGIARQRHFEAHMSKLRLAAQEKESGRRKQGESCDTEGIAADGADSNGLSWFQPCATNCERLKPAWSMSQPRSLLLQSST